MSRIERLRWFLKDFANDRPLVTGVLLVAFVLVLTILLAIVPHGCDVEARRAACACNVAPGETVTLIRADLRAVVLARLPPVDGCPAYQVALQGVPIANAEVLYSDIEECVKNLPRAEAGR